VRLTPAWTIAFERGDDIWTAHGNGTGQKRVIKNGMHPCWSPDKRLIAFERNDNVWIANADGTHQRQFTHRWTKKANSDAYIYQSSEGTHITWNHRYNMITFSHPETLMLSQNGDRNKVNFESSSVYDVMLKNPKKFRTRFSAFDTGSSFVFGSYEYPAWSHSGKDLAYACNGDIWIAWHDSDEVPVYMPMDSWNSLRLAAVASYDVPNRRGSRMNIGISRISWSPDDRSIVYSISRLGGSGWDEVHILNVFKISQGQDLWKVESDIRLDVSNRQSRSPCFSPDGKSIAYSNYATGGSTSIWVMSIANRKRSVLIPDADYPAW
jgi:Tol biopolymer transport system component